jgi:hypothetical protein
MCAAIFERGARFSKKKLKDLGLLSSDVLMGLMLSSGVFFLYARSRTNYDKVPIWSFKVSLAQLHVTFCNLHSQENKANNNKLNLSLIMNKWWDVIINVDKYTLFK